MIFSLLSIGPSTDLSPTDGSGKRKAKKRNGKIRKQLRWN